MLGFIPRIRRRVDRNTWVLIGEDSNYSQAPYEHSPTSARLAGPPNFNDPIPPQVTPPPSYAQVRQISRPEIEALMLRRGSPRAPANATPRESLPPAISSNLTNLEDIRHGEVVHHIHMAKRLSSVPNYPVLLEQPPTTSRRRQSRRPASMASSSSTGLFLSVGQIPGSEPFDVVTSRVVSDRCDAPGCHPISPPLFSPVSPFEASVAQVMTVQRVQTVHGSSSRFPRVANQTSWLPETSPSHADRWNPPAGGYYSPPADSRPPRRQTRTWPAPLDELAPHTTNRHIRLLGNAPTDRDVPPRPPPKDPGYRPRPPVGVRRGHGPRKCNSTPNLLTFASHSKGHDRRRSMVHSGITIADNKSARIIGSKRMSSGRKFSNRPSQILNACARFIHRSVPRITVSY